MYRHQLTHLISEFNLIASQSYPISQLLNNMDYRNHCFAQELRTPKPKMSQLIRQIRAIEDLLSHELRADILDDGKSTQATKNSRNKALAIFGFCGFLFIIGSVFAVAEIKHNREQNSHHQAD